MSIESLLQYAASFLNTIIPATATASLAYALATLVKQQLKRHRAQNEHSKELDAEIANARRLQSEAFEKVNEQMRISGEITNLAAVYIPELLNIVQTQKDHIASLQAQIEEMKREAK